MINHRKDVIDSYDRPNLEEMVFQALEDELGAGVELTPEDLAPVDEFHIRGRESTIELAERLGDLSGKKVLDLGCGPGGTARFLANRFDATVTGIDITPSYISLATKLSEKAGLNDTTQFRTESALDMPFDDGQFDLAWMEHVQMNIDAKDHLVDQVQHVLRDGGTFVFHEIFSTGEHPEFHMPVPWADSPSASFLVPPNRFRTSLKSSGFTIQEWTDVTEPAIEWFETLKRRNQEQDPSPLGLHLLMGENAPQKLGNVGKNLKEQRICVIQAVCTLS